MRASLGVWVASLLSVSLFAPGVARAEGSVKDASSPFASRGCPLKQHLATPTSLPADCRCLTNRAQTGGIDMCKRPFDLAKSGTQIGEGVSFALYNNAHVSGGFIDERTGRLVASIYWSGASTPKGLIVSYDLKTWSRTFVSGEWADANGAKSIGSGPQFTHVKDVRAGKDGAWYALTYAPGKPEIVRVDPATGARSKVWAGGDAAFGQCASGTPQAVQPEARTVQVTHEGFAVEDSGSFLLGYANPQRDGRGIVRISADGKQCTYLSATGTRADKMTRGSGAEMRGFVQGFTLHDGKVWAFTSAEKKLWTIDPVNGDRTVVSDKPLGERWALWDGKRQVMWTAGFQNSVTLGAFDPKSSKFMNVFQDCAKGVSWFPLCAEGPIRINSLNYGPIWLNPKTGNLLLGHDSVGIVEFEPETGNSIIRSL